MSKHIFSASFLIFAMFFIAVPPAHAASPCSAVVTGSGVKSYQVGTPSGDDNIQIQCAIDEAIQDLQTGTAQSATVLLQPGATYHLAPLPRYYDALSIKTSDLAKHAFANLTFNGQGATLALAPTTTGIYVNGCQDCTLENFTVLTRPNPFSHGVVTQRTDTSVDVRLRGGALFSASSYDTVVGKNAENVIFRIPDAQAFPTSLKFPSKRPYVNPAASAGNSAGTEHVVFEAGANTNLLQTLPLGSAVASLVNPPVDAAKTAAMKDVRNAAAAQRQLHPEYGPLFFTGAFVSALFLEQNTGMTVRNVTISDFAGTAINAPYNRGALTFDRIRIVPGSSGGLMSVSAGGIIARNNQQGPLITNSAVIYNGDDAVNTASLPINAVSASGNSADLVNSNSVLLNSITITTGDRIRIINVGAGTNLGTYTVTSAQPYYISATNYGYHVTFASALPAGIVLKGAGTATAFVNLDQANASGRISDNLIMGTERNGIYMGSSATISNNLFIGLGLWAVQYLPFFGPSSQIPSGVWGDLGPVTVTGNMAIDVPFGLIHTSPANISAGSVLHPGRFTVTGNTVLMQNSPVTKSYVINLENTGFFIPTSASGNTIVAPASDTRSSGAEFVNAASGVNASAWNNAFPTIRKRDATALWNAKCAALAASSWQSVIDSIAQTACASVTDATPPTISLTAPVASSTVSDTITVSANANDNIAVASVQFKLDGADLGVEDTASPYSTSWNTTTATNGTHTLQAVARDAAGNRATSTVRVTVHNTTGAINHPPVISSVTGPATIGVGKRGTWTITASDPDGDTLGYRIAWGDGLGTPTPPAGSAPSASNALSYTYTKPGTFTGKAVVRDSDGATTTKTFTVTVNGATDPITLTAADSSIRYNTATTLTWTSRNANLCVLSGPNFFAIGTSGTRSTGPLTQTATYTLLCLVDHSMPMETVTVTVVQPPIISRELPTDQPENATVIVPGFSEQ